MADSQSTASRSIQIDAEFRALIPPLSTEERVQLEENIVRDGCRDPLVVWNGVLLDGHNRYEICQARGIGFETVSVSLESREAAADWIDTNQLGRRNLPPDVMSLLRGRRYNRAKATGFKGNQYTGGGGSGQNVHHQDPGFIDAWESESAKLLRDPEWQAKNSVDSKTAETLAEKYGVSERTIRRDGDFAEAVEALKSHVPDIEQMVMSGDVPSKQAVVEAARDPEKAVEILKMPHVARNSGNNEWYTPQEIVDAARKVLGSIDLDPASSDDANRVIKAKEIYTAEDDGLTQKWQGRVWMNPPYAQPLVSQFADKLAESFAAKEISAAIVLVNNATETGWFRRLAEHASAVCFPDGRVKFWSPDKASATPLQGQALLYLGPSKATFHARFAEIGTVWVKP